MISAGSDYRKSKQPGTVLQDLNSRIQFEQKSIQELFTDFWASLRS